MSRGRSEEAEAALEAVYSGMKGKLAAKDALTAELMEALEAFEVPLTYGDIDSAAPDNGPIITFFAPHDQGDGHSITRGDFRRARSALAKARDAME